MLLRRQLVDSVSRVVGVERVSSRPSLMHAFLVQCFRIGMEVVSFIVETVEYSLHETLASMFVLLAINSTTCA